MNPSIGQTYRFKKLQDHDKFDEPQAPNVFTVTEVTAGHVFLQQSGSPEPTKFTRANFESDFELLRA
jgi:hypothetical protein